MSFRTRLALVAAAAVALAVVAASGVVYLVVRDQLYSSIDNSLRTSMDRIQCRPHFSIGEGPPQPGVFGGYPQVVRADGVVFRRRGQSLELPVDEETIAVARGERPTFIENREAGGTHIRVITFPYPRPRDRDPGRALARGDGPRPRPDQMAPDRDRLRRNPGRGGARPGRLACGARAVRRLTEATETVTATGDLSERIDAGGRDEISRLASSFNAMLGALEESTRARGQLVADASHELRTPLTSLRTNIEVLASDRELPPGERERLLSDVVEQLGEMTNLISELIELARGEQPPAELEDVRLDLVAADAVERTRRNRPGVSFKTDFEESLVNGVPATIDRAVGNLLDNAAKWSPPGGEVEIAVRGAEVTVRDHGPGIDEEDLPYVFDRFYRARSARGQPGSGLGLAIVTPGRRVPRRQRRRRAPGGRRHAHALPPERLRLDKPLLEVRG